MLVGILPRVVSLPPSLWQSHQHALRKIPVKFTVLKNSAEMIINFFKKKHTSIHSYYNLISLKFTPNIR